MNYETLNRLVRKCGKTKLTISAECGISRMTLDTILAGGDMKVSTLEGLAASLDIWPGILFDDPAGTIRQTGEQNNVNGNNVRSEGYIPVEILSMLEARDRQVDRLISVIERTAVIPAALSEDLGKFSAREKDAAALGKFSAREKDAPADGCKSDGYETR